MRHEPLSSDPAHITFLVDKPISRAHYLPAGRRMAPSRSKATTCRADLLKYNVMDTYELRNQNAVTRKIRIRTGEDGAHFLLEVVDASLISPELSWTRFENLQDAELTAKAHYDRSLQQGFVPVV